MLGHAASSASCKHAATPTASFAGVRGPRRCIHHSRWIQRIWHRTLLPFRFIAARAVSKKLYSTITVSQRFPPRCGTRAARVSLLVPGAALLRGNGKDHGKPAEGPRWVGEDTLVRRRRSLVSRVPERHVVLEHPYTLYVN